jgi:EpsD family peptidyl-prolyl cis-trans isomerase
MAGWGAVLGFLGLVAACGEPDVPNEDEAAEVQSRAALAQVNNAELRESDLQRMIPGELRDAITGKEINDILARWVDTELLYQKARHEGLDRDPQVTEQLYEMERQLLADEYLQRQLRLRVRVTPEEIQAYYDANRDLYTQEVHVQHIVVDTIEEAEAVMQELKDGVGFNTLAKKYSTDGSASKGGDIGYLGKGAMNPALESEVFDMKNREVRGPIESGFGFHIVRVVGRRKLNRPTSLDAARDEIMQKLLLEKQQHAYAALLAELRAEANVHVVDSYAGMRLQNEDASPNVPESIMPDSTEAQ